MPARLLRILQLRKSITALALVFFSSCDNVVSQFVNLNLGKRLPNTIVIDEADTEPPVLTGALQDGTNYISLTSSPNISWTAATDNASGVAYYQIAIGSTAGATDLKSWTTISSGNSVQVTGLILTGGTTYYATLRAIDFNGNISSPLNSDGWVAVAPPLTIASIDDDVADPSLTDTPTITWDYPGTLTAGPMNYHFEVAVGTSPGATNVVNWESAGTTESWSKNGLSLTLNNTYYASVRLVDGQGTVHSTRNGDGWKVVSAVVGSARFPIAQNWNQYADRSNTANACPEGVTYFSCIHGGESRRVPYAAAASCTGYSAADVLGAFDWACDDTGGAGNVFFFSRGLKPSKGLADLLNPSSWKTNRVVISSGGSPIVATTRTAWWTNTIVSTFDLATLVPAANTIYTVSSNLSVVAPAAFSMITMPGPVLTNGVGIVVFPGAILSESGGSSGSGLINFGRFAWVEGTFKSDGGSQFIGSMTQQSVFRNVSLENFRWLSFSGPANSYFYNLRISNALTATNFESFDNNVFEKLRIDNIGNGTAAGDGIILTDLEDNNLFIDTLITGVPNRGIYFYSSTGNKFIGLTVTNVGTGVYALGNTNAVLKNVAFVNATTGLNLQNGSRATIDNMTGSSITLFNTSTNKFTNNLILSTTVNPCSVNFGTNPGLVNNTCANEGSSNAFMQIVSAYASTSFVGEVSTEDAANTSDNLGAAFYATITDWFNFDNFFRAWGISGSVANRCYSTNPSCRIMDYSLKTADAHLKGAAAVDPGGGYTVAAFVNGAACPAQLGGNVVSVSAHAAPITYLRNAREILGTGGNNNGLCESNESCLYMPNFGAYQGSGDFWTNSCTFVNGVITGVKMYAYPTN